MAAFVPSPSPGEGPSHVGLTGPVDITLANGPAVIFADSTGGSCAITLPPAASQRPIDMIEIWAVGGTGGGLVSGDGIPDVDINNGTTLFCRAVGEAWLVVGASLGPYID